MLKRRSFKVAVFLLFTTAVGPVWAQTGAQASAALGEVEDVSPPCAPGSRCAEVKPDALAAWKEAEAGKDQVRVGTELKRNLPEGTLSASFTDPTIRKRLTQLVINAGGHVRLEKHGILFLVAGMSSFTGSQAVVTANAIAKPGTTIFVVRYDPATDTTEVVTVGGRVEVANRAGGPAVVILEREYTRVVGGQPPASPRFLDDEEYQRFVKPFAFVGGGRKESVTVNHPVLLGAAVPLEEHAPLTGPPGVPSENTVLDHLGGPFEQPRAVVESTDLEVQF